MRDLWCFLLQTLTASGAAALLLAVKAMFRDKLSPRWQFAIWGVLGLVLVFPAGLGGRYVLFNWPWLVEAARSLLTGEYGVLTQVSVPVPLPPRTPPATAAEWLFALYGAGGLFLLGRYAVSYIRLRRALRRGTPADSGPVRAAAEKYRLPVCPAVEVEGLSSAFVCGVFRPVLALPAGETPDEKILLHELLHLRYHDAAWGLAICFFRCVHWCNPLLWYCAGLAGNDLESLCDQRVLERLEGEDRRDYGRILLRMANEKYARAPGTSSMANGGRNIRRRVEAIARFKRYPAGMALVSVCVALVLTPPLLLGGRAETVRQEDSVPAAMASARTTYCTTYAGAFDAYAKAVLDRNVLYRAMCAPLSEQEALAEQLKMAQERSSWPPRSDWDYGLSDPVYAQGGYKIYNLVPAGKNAYEGLLATEMMDAPEGQTWDSTEANRWLAVQALRAEKEGNRWVIRPLEAMRTVQKDERTLGTMGLPATVYQARFGDFTLQMQYQTEAFIESYTQNNRMFFSSRTFNLTPQPGGQFERVNFRTSLEAIYTGGVDKPAGVRHIGASCAPMDLGGKRPELQNPGRRNSGGSSSSGDLWGATDTFNWKQSGTRIPLGGGGSSYGAEDPETFSPPECYAADLYFDGEKVAELTLLPVEGGGVDG